MTSRNETPQHSRAPEAFGALARAAALAGAAAALLVAPLTGCGQEEEAPVVVAPPPPPPPPPPPAPTITPVAELMKELGISDKIRLPEDKAPGTDAERVAVLRFFDGFAKSQPDAIRAAMSAEDAAILDAMKSGGEFARACDPVKRIDLVTGKTAAGAAYALAVYRAGGQVEGQLWTFKVTGEGKAVATQVFTSVYQPVDIMGRVSGKELAQSWAEIADAERKVATEPDEVLKPVARVQEQEKAEQSGGGSEEQGPIGAPPMRNKPPPGGIDPPRHRPGK